ncbi:MAG: DUF4886 domain-containing protein [Lentisphaeria bacterium]|nr:DUF4886 domain-containing protein [Lentisphaeria bacterium]
MKKAIVLGLAVLCLCACGLSARTLKVLTIGNSFADSVFSYLPSVVAAVPDCELVLDRANIGGCSLERHWREVEKAEADPAYKPYGGKYTLKDKLTSQPWDIITMQQVSSLSFKPESHEPWFKNLYDYVRKYAPQAEIVIQMTWAYRDDHNFFPKVLPGGQEEMFSKLFAAYNQLAANYQLRVIPTGLAVQLARRNQAVKFVPGKHYSKEELAQFVYPDLPKESGGSFITGIHWRKNKDGSRSIRNDLIHLNRRGMYLQACIWFAELYDQKTDVITFVPDKMDPADAAFLRQMAQKARDEYQQPAKKQ